MHFKAENVISGLLSSTQWERKSFQCILFIYFFFHIKICPQVTGLRNCLLSPETVETEIKHGSFGLKDADSFTFGKLPIYESWGCSTSLCLSEVFKHYSNFFFLIHAV